MNRIRQLAWSIYGYTVWDRNRNHRIAGMVIRNIVNTLIVNKKVGYETILDVGCGTGYYASEIARAGFAVTGIDYAKGMIARAKSTYKSNELLRFERVDISKRTLFDDNTFGCAVSISSLQAIPDPVFTLNEIKRLVKQEGLIIIVHASRPDMHRLPLRQQVSEYFGDRAIRNFPGRIMYYLKSYAERKGYSTYWNIGELKSIIDQCGLKILTIDELETIKIITASVTEPR